MKLQSSPLDRVCAHLLVATVAVTTIIAASVAYVVSPVTLMK